MATEVGAALQRLVDPYNIAAPSVLLPSARPFESEGTTDVTAALDAAARAISEHGCPAADVQTEVGRALGAVEARGPVGEAVRDRVLAGIEGRIAGGSAERTVTPGDDLAEALAEAPAGATLLLEAGEYRLSSALVLLDAVTIRGAGRDATVLASSAHQASILVVADKPVRIADLALARDPGSLGSGIVAGGEASLVLDGVRLTGARRGQDQGGAGVLLADAGARAAGRGTTLQADAVEFRDNDWAGLAVTGAHRVSVLDATFAGNGQCGVCFFDSASGSIRDSTFTDNLVGLAITGGATPQVASSTVTGGEVGLQADGDAAATVDGLRIERATRAAVIVTGAATGAIARTTCDSVPFGIVVGDKAAPTLTDNTCTLVRGT